MENEKLVQIISAIHTQLAKNPFVYTSEGKLYESVGIWNHPATENEIDQFFESKGWLVPSDFKHFLMIHNGCTMFSHADAGGGTQILSLEQIDLIK
ncbi:SMI1/KNR4 family protein [Paenibacillus sp. 481]|uniref:SMI1/KNR4 family protein n=1 Tax=Paenibacillus sp. 481 TaxID=2835869 RepID=UPI001E52050A|nr:SMI1/KNR4 family protein [Paenibacillus sp. 481]UHA73746.1 SMI1/KNR4 family protein [Paenibacillus sp. 481]